MMQTTTVLGGIQQTWVPANDLPSIQDCDSHACIQDKESEHARVAAQLGDPWRQMLYLR